MRKFFRNYSYEVFIIVAILGASAHLVWTLHQLRTFLTTYGY